MRHKKGRLDKVGEKILWILKTYGGKYGDETNLQLKIEAIQQLFKELEEGKMRLKRFHFVEVTPSL